MAKPGTQTGDGETAGMSPRTQRGGMRLRAARGVTFSVGAAAAVNISQATNTV